MKLIRLVSLSLLASAFYCTPAFAVPKEMIQLQAQVSQLQEAVARLQQANDERMGAMKDLLTQTADSVNKMSAVFTAVQSKLTTQAEAQGGKMDQVSGQVQALNDSLDELKARLGRMEKAMNDMQNQQQSINAKLDNSQPGTGMSPASGPGLNTQPAPSNAPADNPFSAPPAPITRGRNGKPSAAVPAYQPPIDAAPQDVAPAVADTNAPPASDLYQTAYADYVGAKYALAGAEFARVVKSYPDNPLSGNASYYLGEIDYRGGKYNSAIKNYDRVLEQYPGNPKTAIAQLHKGYALIEMKQREAGARELRSLVQRYPNSTEANQARAKLNSVQ